MEGVDIGFESVSWNLVRRFSEYFLWVILVRAGVDFISRPRKYDSCPKFRNQNYLQTVLMKFRTSVLQFPVIKKLST